MNERQNLIDVTNYIILIQQKKNRRLKRKTTYLTNDFSFSEKEDEAIKFENISQAEHFLSLIQNNKNLTSKPRIFIKYIGE